MPKPANLIPSRQLNVALPLPIFTRLTLHLNSDLEGRVPHGAYSRFLVELLRQHFDQAELDLGSRFGGPPGIYLIRGEAATIALLEKDLS